MHDLAEIHRHSDGFAQQLSSGSHRVLRRFLSHLNDRRFWIVQFLILMASGIHLGFDGLEAYRGVRSPDLFVVLMYAILFVPVIYASLSFGRDGAIPTAIWLATLALPSIVFFHHGLDRIAETVQHLTIIALAVFIASHLDREIDARRRAEAEERARRVSEAMYRGLFESAGEAILVVDSGGKVLQANDASSELFDRPIAGARGTLLADLVGASSSAHLLEIGHNGEVFSQDFSFQTGFGREVWVEPVCSVVSNGLDEGVVQILLRDVTERRARQLGLETYARRITQAQEEERRRIARELHDSSLQSVVLLCRRLDVLEQDTDLPDAVQKTLTETRESAESIADELRRFSRDLRPSILDDLGLIPALRWLARDLKDRTGVRVDLNADSSITRLSPDTELGVFRMCQEALHNVERHSEACSVGIHVVRDDEHLKLIIADDGCGMRVDDAMSTPVRSGKLGLLGMQERARLLDGTVKIVSASGRGTQVEIRIPWRDD